MTETPKAPNEWMAGYEARLSEGKSLTAREWDHVDELRRTIANMHKRPKTMTDAKQTAIDKARELSEFQNSAEMRERERKGLRKPLKLELSDEWCSEMADREGDSMAIGQRKALNNYTTDTLRNTAPPPNDHRPALCPGKVPRRPGPDGCSGFDYMAVKMMGWR